MYGVGSVIHIGYHKTGTNWFQRRLYPKVRDRTYISRNFVRSAFLHPHALQFDPEKARQNLGIGKEENPQVILCEEELSGNIHLGGLRGSLSKDVAYRLYETLPGADIVIFIRNQFSAIASSYVQYVKEGGTKTPKKYFYPEKNMEKAHYCLRYAPHFSFDHFDYEALITHYRSIFGKEKVWVFTFESFAKDPLTFSKKYLAKLGLEADFESIDLSAVNPSHPAIFLPIARTINRFSWRHVPDKHYFFDVPGAYRFQIKGLGGLVKAVRPLGLSSFKLDRSTEGLVQERFAEGNRAIEKEFGLPLSEYGYPGLELSEGG